MHDFFSSFDTGTQKDMAVLDFSKTFDTVPHSKTPKKYPIMELEAHHSNG